MSATSRTTTREAAYLGLLIVGIVIPYTHFVPWLAARGVDVPRFVDDLFVNRISSFFGWDVLLSAVTLVVLALLDRELPGRDRTIVAVSAFLGASVGLPMYRWLRERHHRLRTAQPPAPAPANTAPTVHGRT
ncbi:hypothetical protein TUM20983_37300 [Mycobacterium antarcticum]|uniref:DUF2834 domain-containing protein n=1 Tax=Mycolicibacterium sp. TUM20983 TaxID=3023369 RepID=UPI0023856F36|nr:DUF2834 domain-containing protein [Mycolicibacterium sp. TUM20983]GLP76620.1 hypothetical protein TUM20983_37300 [Mycolicibacterium sp. TUM20983]